MRRVLMMMALALILIGAMSQQVNSYNRPIIEGQDYSDASGDHPWGGDGVTTGGSDAPPRPTSFTAPVTGFGPVDLLLKFYYAKMARYNTSARLGQSVGAKTTTVTPTTGTPTTETPNTSSSGTVVTNNE